jgi:flagellar hook-associated protein 2
MESIPSRLNAGAGIDTISLVSQLVAAERAPRAASLSAQKTENAARLSALSQVRAGMAAFSSALDDLIASGATGVQPASSDPARVAISRTSAGAAPLSTSLEVEKLATRQVLAFPPHPNARTPLGDGTFLIRRGTLTDTSFAADMTVPPLAITLTPANNSLEGLARSINDAAGGITASIVTEASGARLVLKGSEGKQSGFIVETSATQPQAPLAAMSFGVGHPGATLTQAASDLEFRLDGVSATARSNRLTSLLAGYDIDVRQTTAGQPVTLSSDYRAADLKTSVSNFVAAFNEMTALLSDMTRARTDTTEAGPLKSDTAVRELRRQLSTLNTARVVGGSGIASLADIGVRINRDGSLSLSEAKLDRAIATAPAQVSQLFTGTRFSSHSAVAVPSVATRPTLPTGTFVLTNITAATAATLVGTSVPDAFATPVIIDSSNATLRLRADGRDSLRVEIPAGSYPTPQAFISALTTALNTDPVMAAFGLVPAATWSNNQLTLTSATRSAQSSLSVQDMDPALALRLGLAATTDTPGHDSSGTINGIAATGSGNQLTARQASGLTFTISGDAPAATVDISAGMSGLLKSVSDQIGGPAGGISVSLQRLQKSQSALATSEAQLETKSSLLRARLTRQFSAMDSAVASFKSTQTFLQQQIDIWTKK